MSKELDPFRILANLTHELKTPLHSILSVAGILSSETDGTLNEEQKKQVSIIQRNGEHLLDLITELLSFASTSSNSRELKIRKIFPEKILAEIIQEIEPLAKKKSINISFDSNSCPEFIYSDSYLFNKIVNNLIGNAIKFTNHSGTISISASAKRDNSFIFHIADDGIGMDSVTKENLFSAFYQADSSSTRQYGGVGLGLSLVKNAINLLQGKIEVQSEPKSGSSFLVELPDLSDKLLAHNILLCSDDDTMKESLKLFFDIAEYILNVCNRSELSSYIKDNSPSLILLDIPDISNIDNLKGSILKTNIPLIGICPLYTPKLRTSAIQAGFHELLPKPFKLDELLAKISLLVLRE